MRKRKKKVAVFGVFDLLHRGHISFLEQARSLGDQLIVIVADSFAVQELKQKKTQHSLSERIKNIQKLDIASRIIKGDRHTESWSVLNKIKPDIIAIGYDQHKLAAALQKSRKNFSFHFKLKRLRPHKAHLFHTTIINKRK